MVFRSTVGGFSSKGRDPAIFFAFSDFTTPTTIYQFDASTGEITLFAQPNIAFDPTAYVTQQLFYPSKDGTPLPMFLIRRADVAQSGKSAPTLLYGYGGFKISLTPDLSATRLAWLAQRGAVATANQRGGSAYGASLHGAGRLRTNTQDLER